MCLPPFFSLSLSFLLNVFWTILKKTQLKNKLWKIKNENGLNTKIKKTVKVYEVTFLVFLSGGVYFGI